jgi:gliding motility-associated-like protein
VLQVRLVPYDGFGCPQTLTARLEDNLNFAADAGRDTLSCNLAPVRLGAVARPGLRYQWTPATGLSNPQAANPIAAPPATTQYILKVSSPGGGCVSTDTVQVIASNLTNSLALSGAAQYCLGSADSAVLQVGAVAFVQWYKNGQLLPGETQRRYRPGSTGVYHAFLRDEYGCSDSTTRQLIDISSIPTAAVQVPQTAQCLVGNQFTFSSTSTNAVGAMQYQWWLDGQPASTSASWTHQFATAGAHHARLVVRSNAVCADSVEVELMLYQNPVPKFDATAACIEQPFVPLNQTDEQIGSPIRYSWLVDGQPYSELRQPPAQVFAQGGAHRITLLVSSQQCPLPLQSLSKSIVVERPAPPQRYPAVFAIRQVPLQLAARSVGVLAQWQPATQLNDAQTYRPVFTGTQSQDYAIVLTSRGGCVTVDSVLVEIVQRANIEVPTAFTPNGDGRNDELKPVPMGIAEIRYFRIFNRWGQLLYESRQSRTGWDGTFKGQPVATQAVVWMVEGVGLDGTVITKKGTTVLIR